MQAENWQTIKETLLEALRLDAPRRRDYLESANLSAEVRAEVESLLTHESSAQDFMSLTASGFAREFFSGIGESENSLSGHNIGIYQIVSELGFGGMGAVYLAKRADGKFEQRVAIKLLRRELNTEEIRRNFEREKKILATLSHPNIASLLDAGTTNEGIPYLVMEYIEGEPIDKFCQGRKLSLELRLKLFNKVCDTVAVAHRSLIVHRDLKPSNILVTKDGEPKLLDFGISKLLDAEAEGAGSITHLGAMTPLYASPEQIKGQPVTTATDVYSLGVVLFKILTGSLPNTLKNQTLGNGNLFRDVAPTTPTLPSEVARRSLAGEGPPANTSNTDRPPISSAELKGDLDNIVLKALRIESDKRYQTVEQFSADVWRFVDGKPVLARPATLSYRAIKFYGRNKVSVFAAAGILVSLFLGIAVALSQANAAREQARIIGDQRDAAQQASARAEKTSRFMQSFLEYANPNWYGRGKGRMDVTVREAIDDAASRIDTELADVPEVCADLHHTVGEIYRVSGDYEAALRHFRRSLALYRQVHGERHPSVARGIYYLCVMMGSTGSTNEEVEQLLRQGVQIMRETGPDNVNLPHMLQSLAGWITIGEERSKNESRLAEAESLLLEAKRLFVRHYGENHLATITVNSTFIKLAETRGDLELAETIADESLRRFRQTAEGSESHIFAVVSLAGIELRLGKQAEAETLFDQASELGRTHWGPDDHRFKSLIARIAETRARSRR